MSEHALSNAAKTNEADTMTFCHVSILTVTYVAAGCQ